MIVIYYYLESRYDIVFAFHVNNWSYFEISTLPSKKHRILKLQNQSSVGSTY